MKEISFFKNFFNRKKSRQKILKNFSKKRIKKFYIKDYINFGKTYFDSSSVGIGYGGYNYDGRFKKVVKQMINFFNLKKNYKFLEIGCAKGYLLVEFYKYGLNVVGLDKSEYAKKNCHKLLRKYIFNFNIEKKLNFKDQHFDLIICKEVFPHIFPSKINRLMKEIVRVSKKPQNIYLCIQTFKKEKDRLLFKKWDLTHKSNYSKKEWNTIFEKNKFKGYIEYKYLF